jgi:hypothetical protein
MHEVYIIRAGFYPFDDKGLADRVISLTCGLMERIAIARDCRSYFEEDLDADSARVYNAILDELSPGRRDEMLAELEHYERFTGSYGRTALLRHMAQARDAGTPIGFKPTEERLDPIAAVRGKVSLDTYRHIEQGMALSRRLGMEDDAIKGLYDDKTIADLLYAHRDAEIVQSIRRHGKGQSILAVGLDRMVRGIDEAFTAYPITLLGQPERVHIYGRLPGGMDAELRRMERPGIEVRVSFPPSA